MTRREQRNTVMQLLFENDFRREDTPETVYARAKETREFPEEDYVRDLFFNITKRLDVYEKILDTYAANWSASRISKISRAAMFISIYEMVFREDIPVKVSINEAVEIVKTYDEEKAAPFVNGILNTVKDHLDDVKTLF